MTTEKNFSNTPARGVWLPPGLAAIDRLETLHALEAQIASGAALRAQGGWAGSDEDWEEYVARRADRRVGLRIMPGGVAIQPVAGVLMDGVPVEYEAYYNVMNTARIRHAAAAVAADSRLRALVLDFRSPGGYVTGVGEAANAIEALPSVREGVEVIGYVSQMACSAAAWISAGCQVIKAAPSAILGSVGVYNYLVDSSKYYDELGVEVILATDGKYKAMGMPGVEVSKAQREWLERGVMETSAEFKGYMKRRRKGIEDETMQGQTFAARRAPAGLHDGTEFESLEELIAAAVAL